MNPLSTLTVLRLLSFFFFFATVYYWILLHFLYVHYCDTLCFFIIFFYPNPILFLCNVKSEIVCVIPDSLATATNIVTLCVFLNVFFYLTPVGFRANLGTVF